MVRDAVTKIMTRLAARIEQSMRQLPASTYRLQFHAGFTFRDAREIVPYLHDLGITHCYASPYLKARAASQHGYDIADHRQLNHEIGSEADYNAWIETLHAHGMGHILDMVPNHMGVMGNENPWRNDVLENGPSSPYAHYFDIAWQSSPRRELQNRVLIPVLGDPYGKVLESGQLKLAFDDGAFSIQYFEHSFPIDPGTYDAILGLRMQELETGLQADNLALIEYRSILTAISHLPGHSVTDPEKIAERQREKEVIKRRIAVLVQENEELRQHIEGNVAILNGDPQVRESFDALDSLLDRQAYRLSFWRVALDEINYRRFFDVNELAALNMEREDVFLATHEFVLGLVSAGKIEGLRIDHPDGLYDPKKYLELVQLHFLLSLASDIFHSDPPKNVMWSEVESQLRDELSLLLHDSGPQFRPLYVVVEKILAGNEHLPDSWRTYGTSGYDFLNMVNGLFVDSANAEKFTQLYSDWIEEKTRFAEVAYRKKSLILEAALSSELHMLAYQLDRLAQKDRWSRDFTFNGLRQALAEVIACFPVYRSYISDEGVGDTDKLYVHTAINRAIGRNPTISRSIFHFIRDMLLLKYRDHFGEEDQQEQRRFAGKFQQVTSPVAAKGVEDTAFYVYARLLSLNEVGGEPDRFGLSAEKLHRYAEDRRANWPYSLSCLSTHDTKRSEDVRARINVLSEIPDEWNQHIRRWRELNQHHRRYIDEEYVPDRNEEYLLYQTLVGAWPLEPLDDEQHQHFLERIQAYMTKALHEAKIHSSWINPYVEYDQAVCEFIARMLDRQNNEQFLQDFQGFHERVSYWGMFNSLSQTLLRITLPGVPDTYQAAELWNFTLVDPDNRRAVDFEERRTMLTNLKRRVSKTGRERVRLIQELLESARDGRIKMFVTWRSLECRRRDPQLFTIGQYIPLEISGAKKDHVFAFARQDTDQHAIVAVPRKIAGLCGSDQPPIGQSIWEDTTLTLPDGWPALGMRNIFTGELLEPKEQENRWTFPVTHLLGQFPVAVLMSEQP